MKRGVVAVFALLVGASSCSSCESCKGSAKGPDGGSTPAADATAPVVSAPPPKPAYSGPPMEANYACRMLARAITEKACSCPQKNKMGCCYIGLPAVEDGGLGPTPYVSCSGGKTDWPSDIETRLCEVGKDEKMKDLLFACYQATKPKLECGKTAQGDVGVMVPRECETLMKGVQAAAAPKK